MEHLHHFGLSEDPFRNEPRMRDFLETGTQREALVRLDRGLRQAKGLLVLTGDTGSGKTMLVRRLLESLEEEIFEASMLVVLNGAADANWMLTRFARQLGVEEPDSEREAILAQVYEQLAIVREDGRHAVLIIDDAHLLAPGSTLAEVCGLLKLEYEDRRLFSLVLSGGAQLDAAVSANPSLSHAVQIRVRMQPLDAEGAVAYLGHRIKNVGGAPSILETPAVVALHRLGRGLPGLMNTLADNALFEAFLCGRSAVTEADVVRAHADLGWQAAPAPRRAGPAPAEPVEAAGPDLPLLEPLDASLESELEAVFDTAPGPRAALEEVAGGDVPDLEDLVVELIDG